jgi:hypothetical protein
MITNVKSLFKSLTNLIADEDEEEKCEESPYKERRGRERERNYNHHK